ncbi:unnamed protein product [Rotaria sordida]|uniref:DUF732 domain-containing protein n=1 Tax=Rotaria sordida TaxID=392033 RepID=A0A813TQP7_9BILA|nr:unnamed protein product [Rotaria sordida]
MVAAAAAVCGLTISALSMRALPSTCKRSVGVNAPVDIPTFWALATENVINNDRERLYLATKASYCPPESGSVTTPLP